MFVAVKEAILPEPLVARPMLLALLVHVYVVPVTELVNATAVVADPWQSIWSVGVFTSGVGFIVTVMLVTATAIPSETWNVSRSVPL